MEYNLINPLRRLFRSPRKGKIKRVVFTGDIFKTTAGEPNQLQNAQWMARKLGPVIAPVTQLRPEIRFRGPVRKADQASGVAPRLFAAMDETPSLDAWARLFWRKPTAKLLDLLYRDYSDAMVIGFEIPPIMESVLDELRCPWINLGVGPLRFMQDHTLSFRMSADFSFPARFAVIEKDVLDSADRVREHYAPVRREHLENSVVFFAQTIADRTTIKDGRFAGVDDVLEGLREIVRGKRLWVKPHPLAPETEIVRACVDRLGGSITDTNTYAILSADCDVAVATLSSSVGLEAKAFRKTAHVFHEQILTWSFSGPASLQHALSPRLWAALLSQVMPTCPPEERGWSPNELRNDIGHYGLDPGVWS